MLVDYAESEGSASPPSSSTTNLIEKEINSELLEEQEEDEFDPSDVFGVNKIKTITTSTSNSNGLKGKSIEMISAPDVIVNVSSKKSLYIYKLVIIICYYICCFDLKFFDYKEVITHYYIMNCS